MVSTMSKGTRPHTHLGARSGLAAGRPIPKENLPDLAPEKPRLRVLNHLEAGTLTVVEAAQLVGVSPSQLQRVRARCGRDRGGPLAHGNWARRPAVPACMVAACQHMDVKIEGLDHVAITVTDVARSVAWYDDTLGFERYHEDTWGDEPAVIGSGGTGLALFASSVSLPAPPPGKDTLSMRHVAFRADRSSWEELRERFHHDAVPYELEDHGISHSLYVTDPDGHRIEITTYDI